MRTIYLTVLMLLVLGCGGNVDRDVESPFEAETGIGVTRGDERPPAQGVPTWEDASSGSFMGNSSGTAVVYERDGLRNLRFESFSTDACEEGRVYLASEEERVDLGMLQHTRGSQGYGIPGFVSLDEYDTVVLWCKTGRVLGTAELG